MINIYQNGKLHKTQVVDKNATGYSFINLDKYDNELNPYTYKVEETFTSSDVYKMIDEECPTIIEADKAEGANE